MDATENNRKRNRDETEKTPQHHEEEGQKAEVIDEENGEEEEEEEIKAMEKKWEQRTKVGETEERRERKRLIWRKREIKGGGSGIMSSEPFASLPISEPAVRDLGFQHTTQV